jgi:hypothetical protein
MRAGERNKLSIDIEVDRGALLMRVTLVKIGGRR